jgi:purine-binding chemotaxis protein CheW
MRQIEANSVPVGTSEFLTFRLGQEEYGIDILRVQEIRGYDSVTPIANSPAFLKGVINLRGTIVPIVDLRIKFQVCAAAYDQFTVVIILNIGSRVVGVVVDSVSDVTMLSGEQIRPTPELGGAVDTSYIKGLAPVADRMLILLDIEKMMLARDMGLVEDERLAA